MPTISALPTAPSRSSPGTFATLADAWVTWFTGMTVTEMNTALAYVASSLTSIATSISAAAASASAALTSQNAASTSASNASTSASTATTQAGNASTSASTATTQVGIATTQAGIATTQATNASNSAAAAAASVASIAGGPVASINGLTGVVTGIAQLTAAQTLTNKTLTAPNVDQLDDTSGLIALKLTPTASAVNYAKVVNAATGTAVQLAADGTDANVDLNLVSKGAGVVRINGAQISGATPDFLLHAQGII